MIKNTFFLGVAKQKINPPLREPLMGFPGKRLNQGIGSDLYVRSAVFAGENGRPAAALAMLDTVYAPAPVVAAIRRAVARKISGLDAKAIMIGATHTHSGPTMQAFYGTYTHGKLVEPNRRYLDRLIKTVVASIVRAWGRRHRVTASYGVAQAHLGHNRRVIVHGYARNEWLDPEGKHEGYFNPDVPFISFQDAGSHRVRAVIAGYGCHPVAIGPGSCRASADYPGYLVAALEKATGAEVAIHITTGAANINPRVGLSDNSRQAQIMGKKLAAAILASLPRARPAKINSIFSRSAPLRFLVRSNLAPGPKAIVAKRLAKQHLQTEVQAIHLGDLALVTAPGELFAEIATRLRKRSPVKHTIVVEHANDVVGYMFTDEAALEGGYEVCRGSIAESMERPYLAAALKALGRR